MSTPSLGPSPQAEGPHCICNASPRRRFHEPSQSRRDLPHKYFTTSWKNTALLMDAVLNDAGGGIPQVTFLQVVNAPLPGVRDTAMDPLVATPHVVVKLLFPSGVPSNVTRRILEGDQSPRTWKG